MRNTPASPEAIAWFDSLGVWRKLKILALGIVGMPFILMIYSVEALMQEEYESEHKEKK